MRLLTPYGRSGIAVVAARGAVECRALAACLFTHDGATLGLSGVSTSPRPRSCRVVFDGIEIDHALAIGCDDEIEVHLHGSPAVLAAFVQRFGSFAEVVVPAAEWLLRTAGDEAQLALALEQRACDFDGFLARLRAMPLSERRHEAAAAVQRSRTTMAMVQPHRLVLVGAQNAGKSTFLNRLLFRERALTGPLPGLTRDPVRETTCLSGYPYEFVDTAGEGAVHLAVDAAALQQARTERHDSDRLLVVDGNAGVTDLDRSLLDARTLVVCSKADLTPAPWPADFPRDLVVSCLEAGSTAVIRGKVGEHLRRHRRLPVAGPVGGPAALDATRFGALHELWRTCQD
jgi:small GTP-binding protein